MVWEGVEGVGSPIEEEVEGVEGVGSPVGEKVEGVGPSVVGLSVAVDYPLVFFSCTLFMYVSCDFLPCSTLLGSFVTFCDILSMFYFKQNGKD